MAEDTEKKVPLLVTFETRSSFNLTGFPSELMEIKSAELIFVLLIFKFERWVSVENISMNFLLRVDPEMSTSSIVQLRSLFA